MPCRGTHCVVHRSDPVIGSRLYGGHLRADWSAVPPNPCDQVPDGHLRLPPRATEIWATKHLS